MDYLNSAIETPGYGAPHDVVLSSPRAAGGRSTAWESPGQSQRLAVSHAVNLRSSCCGEWAVGGIHVLRVEWTRGGIYTPARGQYDSV